MKLKPSPWNHARKYCGLIPLGLAAVVVIAPVLLSGCVTMEEQQALSNRVMLLEQDSGKRLADLDTRLLNIESGKSETEAGLRQQVAQLRAQNEALMQQVSQIQGALEETGFQVNQKGDRITLIEERIAKLEQGAGASLQRLDGRVNQMETMVRENAAPAGGEAQPPARAMGEDEMYEAAKGAYDQGDFEAARKKFQAFLSKYPKSKNANSAMFWCGETYFQQQWYEKAILEYQNVIEKFPNGNKVPAALLKQGMSFALMGDKTNARQVWNMLIKRYSSAPEAETARRKMQSLK
jgi:tol-pal system protein YbgF